MLAVAAGAFAVMAFVGTAGAAAAGDPPGNNGTVKIDGVEWDQHPDNEPHVGCEFQVDFYGYDEGDLEATVTFEAIDPTGGVDALLDGTLTIGEDPAGGGTDVDAEATYDLTESLAAITPHSQQGWHVKLTVHAEGSIGADTKYKVFWVSGCESTPPTSDDTTPGTPPTSSSDTTVPGSTATTVDITPGSTIPDGGGGTPADPEGPSTEATDISPTASSGDLPRTGSDSAPLAAIALGLVVVGGAGIFAARHLRTAGE
jgi:LPXTG-motif cell wall-anchored protein